MEQEKPTVYIWDRSQRDEIEKTNDYKHLTGLIAENGFVSVRVGSRTAKVYSAGLAYQFSVDKLKVWNRTTKQETQVPTLDFLKTYVQAFENGKDYFKTEYGINPNTLYGNNVEQYVKDIHYHYFHAEHYELNEGWYFVKTQAPFILTHQAFRDFGYYAGIISEVEAMVKKYPRLFQNFDKCEHSSKKDIPDEKDCFLPLATLKKIHDEFKDDIFKHVELHDFYRLFDTNCQRKPKVIIKGRVNFYALLYKMNAVSGSELTLEQFIFPLLEHLECSPNSYGNILKTRINKEMKTPAEKKLLKRIDSVLK